MSEQKNVESTKAVASPSQFDLLDCPHCKGEGSLKTHGGIRGLSIYSSVGYRVECEGECHSMTCYWHTKEQAIEAWNKRASLKWVVESPTEEGWFWLKAGGRGSTWTIERVYYVNDSLRFGNIYPGVGVEMVSSQAKWAGPIQEPTEI